MSDNYDPTCHCGISLSQHSVYDNHSFTEMPTFESMSAERKALVARLLAFRWILDNEADCSEVDGPNTHAKLLADFDQMFAAEIEARHAKT